jgi:peptide deformylase
MTKALSIVHWPDPRLKTPSASVTAFDGTLRDLANDMFALMREEKGVGLAAPQIGRNLRLFVMNHTGEPADDRVYVNPVLTPLGDTETESEEGCLSIPDVRIRVWRADKMRIDAQDLDGKPISIERDGFETRVWQHENDHLLGILLTDRMSFTDKMRYRRKLKTLEEQHQTAKKS